MLKRTVRLLPTFLQATNNQEQVLKVTNRSELCICSTRWITSSIVLYKKANRSKQQEESGSDSEDDKFDDLVDKNSKILDLKVTNLRLDGVLKAGLGMARNKIELNFYESKIRLNGEKVLKKSEAVDVGDEIDIIKGPSPTNPKLLTVARVEVLSIHPKDEYIALKLRRCKSLLIENYKNTSKCSNTSDN